MKLNIYGHQPIIAPRDPELPMEVTTKNYVDTLVGTHASDFSPHLTPSQNAWLDAITVTAEEVNSLAGATNGGLQSQIDQKVNRSGDVMTGALTLYGSPSENLHAAPKQYVDSEAAKLKNIDPYVPGSSYKIATGIKGYSNITDKVELVFSGEYNQYSSEISDSPLTRGSGNFSILFGLNYKFGF